jgi:tetratricopeptide (TPR) repeat protein
LLIAMGQPQSAIYDFDVAIEANPEYMEAYLNRSMMLALTGKQEKAQDDVEKAVALGADRPSLESRIAEIRDQAESGT